MVGVTFKAIKKNYGAINVVKSLDLEVKDHEFVVLVGPSGCGKSTTLRMLAGLEEITDGNLYIGKKRVNDLPPADRGVAMVFQDYALYPHMTVYNNLAFSLKLKRIASDEIDRRVKEAADMLDLTEYLDRKPAALSGGQRQRVAMGRAIVKKTEVFLYDEPLSNLDAKLRSKMRGEIKKFHLKGKTTSIYVTHDQLEAMTLADRLVVMKDGIIQQTGCPLEVFGNPRNTFVATFIGNPGMNLFDAKIVKDGDDFLINGDGAIFSFRLPESKCDKVKDGMKVVMGIRPSDIFVSVPDDHIASEWKVKGQVDMIELLGKNAYVTMTIGKTEFLSDVMGRTVPEIGETVALSFNLNHIQLFDAETRENLNFA